MTPGSLLLESGSIVIRGNPVDINPGSPGGGSGIAKVTGSSQSVLGQAASFTAAPFSLKILVK